MTTEIIDAIEGAIAALSLAKLKLAKAAIPGFSESDILRKGKPALDPAEIALTVLADATARVTRLEAARDESQFSPRKTMQPDLSTERGRQLARAIASEHEGRK